MPEHTHHDPNEIPMSPEVMGEHQVDPVRIREAKVEAFLAAAELRSPVWALELRNQYAEDPALVEELADAFKDLDRLAGLTTSEKIA